jgi:hypothetical protein
MMPRFPRLPALGSLLFLLASTVSQATLPVAPGTPSASRSHGTTAVRAVTGIAAGQAGYVHYFLITHPDGTPEDHVGIELEDQRIAWSFPGAGVIVSGFVKNGPLEVAGQTFLIEHLHGIRPFRTENEMRLLRNELPARVAYWIDEETPYCIFPQPGEQMCLSCGDFVVRILFPATNPLMVGLPREFTRALNRVPTTDDLLIYMLGLHHLPDAKSRLKQLAKLDLPDSLRMDVTAMLQEGHPVPATTPRTAGIKKPASRLATRRTQNRRL